MNISSSRLRQIWLFIGWILVSAVVYLSLAPVPEVPVEQGDKLAHIAAYLAIMSWFVNLYEAPRERVLCAAGFIALGIGLELAQRWTDARTCDAVDMAANAAGVMIAYLLAPPRMPSFLRLTERILRVRPLDS